MLGNLKKMASTDFSKVFKKIFQEEYQSGPDLGTNCLQMTLDSNELTIKGSSEKYNILYPLKSTGLRRSRKVRVSG